jgi:hypothetical protein
MGALRNMLNLFRQPPPMPPRPLPVKVRPEREGQISDLERAKKANDRAALGVVVTSSQAMAEESSVQAMLRGLLNEADRGRDTDGRH